jgi:hypothetical protein
VAQHRRATLPDELFERLHRRVEDRPAKPENGSYFSAKLDPFGEPR